MECWFRLSSGPPTGAAALGVVDVYGDVAGLLAALGAGPVEPGRAGLRAVPGVDTLVIARTGPTHALLFPHAGRAVGRRLVEALRGAGAWEVRGTTGDPRAWYPEAASLLEARQLAALARAQSPLAVDLLLDQPRRWALVDRGELHPLCERDCRVLRRLIDPPLVALLGAPNIGKSSLVNALAGRGVSIVADEPGTTRDHAGVSLNLAGLVVRFIDTPGIDAAAAGEIDREAQRMALTVAAAADVLLLCADAGSAYLSPPPGVRPDATLLCVGLRSDLGPPATGADVLVSAKAGTGLETLTARVLDALVPPGLLEAPGAWTFWEDGA